jgi:hypothetical protein
MKNYFKSLVITVLSVQLLSTTGHAIVKFRSDAWAVDNETLNWVWNAVRACHFARETALRDIKENKCPEAGYRESTCQSVKLNRWWINRKFKSPQFDFDQFSAKCEVGVEASL